VDEARKIKEAVKKTGGEYSILLRELYGENNDRSNVDLMDTAPVMALTGMI
jgi:hypothetical protein